MDNKKYNFRKSELKDIDLIMEIINQGKESLKKQGIYQWQDGYPNKKSIIHDIETNNSFVLEIEDEIIATVALIIGIEPTYKKIYGGFWNHQGNYASIHRIAIKANYQKKGLGKILLTCSEKYLKHLKCNIIRVDTHYRNQAAINLFERNDFERCGVIFLKEIFEEDNARVAFDKLIR